MAYQILRTDGTLLTAIADGTISAAYSTIQLPGRNYNGYGQFVDTNFIHLLENFCGTVAPTNTLRGQLWFRPGVSNSVANSRLSVAMNDGGPGLTSTWANVMITTGDPNNPIIEGNLTVNGWSWVKGNSRVDGTTAFTNPANPANITDTGNTSFYAAGGAIIQKDLRVGGNVYGNFEGNFSGNIDITGSANGVVFKNDSTGQGFAEGAEYFEYSEVSANGSTAGYGNAKIQGNLIIENTSNTSRYIKALTQADVNLVTNGTNVHFGNAPSGGALDINSMNIFNVNDTAINVTTNSKSFTSNVGTDRVYFVGTQTQTTVSTGPFRIGNAVGSTPQLSIGPNIYSDHSGLFNGNIIVGANVRLNSDGSGVTNDNSNVTIYGTKTAHATTAWGNSALNANGGAAFLGNVNLGNGEVANGKMFVWNSDTVSLMSATSFTMGSATGAGAIQANGSIATRDHLYSMKDLSTRSIVLRAGSLTLDKTGEVSMTRNMTGSYLNQNEVQGTSANIVFYFNSGSTAPFRMSGESTPNAATFQFGITGPNISAGSTGSAPNPAAQGTIYGNWTLSAGSRFQATYADLAERFEADAYYEPGTVLEFGGDREVTAVVEDLSENVFGVVSDTAAMIMNGAAGNDATHPAIALQGRVKVNVTGKIRKGDRLVSAGKGLARSARTGEANSFNTIGRALENKTTNGVGKVLAAVTAKLS